MMNPGMTRHFGGEHAFRPPKENGQFFELQRDYGNVFGNHFAGEDQTISLYWWYGT